jgi:multiple sugar transport system substrate-binding protein
MKKNLTILVLVSFIILVLGIGSCSEQAASGPISYTRWAGTQEALDFQKLVDAYMKKNPNVKIVTDFLPWGAYWEKVRNSLISGEAADVISMANGMAGPYIAKKTTYKMDDLPGAKALLDEMQPGTKFVATVEGSIYAMPVGAGVRAMIYNKALLKDAGVANPSSSEPMSWDDFIAMGKKLIKKSGDQIVQYPAHFHKMEMWQAFIVQMGGKLLDSPTKPTKILANSPEGVAGLQIMVDLIKADILPPHTGDWAGAWGTPDNAVANGKVAFMQTGPWGLGPLKDNNIDFATAPIPKGKVRCNLGYVNSLAIAKNSKNVTAAWDFIRWVCSEEGQLEFTKTGDLPANKKAFDKAKAGNTQWPANIMDAYFSELPYTITSPMLPSGELDSLFDDVMTQCFQLKITPAQAAARLEKEGNEIVKKMFQ